VSSPASGARPGGGSGPSRPAALLVVRIGPADVGRRVTVRHRLDATTLTDVVGILRSWNGGATGELVVERRDGRQTRVAADVIVAAKVVAPELSAEAMQAVAEAGWPPAESTRLGDWVLRATAGVTARANSARVTGDPGMPLAQALATVQDWYAERGLPPLLQLPTPSLLDDELDAAGWIAQRRTLVRVGPTPDIATTAAAGSAVGLVVERLTDATAEVLDFVEPALDPPVLAGILSRPVDRVVVTVRAESDGALLGTGRASTASSSAGRWAGITSVATAPEARRRGVAHLVLRELATWALERDARHTYLQVMADNDPANSLFDRLGTHVHHSHDYRSPGAVRFR
jgi:ribosomal protein S18 acetylase RimI-like enzyme